MFQRVVVPVDLTPRNAKAVDVARRLVGDGGSVVLLHVIETLDLPFEELEDFYRKLEEKAMETMAEMAGPLRDAGVPFDQNVRYGDRAEEIVAFSREDGADLVLLTSHRVDLESPGSSWTTLSYKVAILAQCPVLLLK
jgi:nucleotide-binding universal stress UspA family protein